MLDRFMSDKSKRSSSKNASAQGPTPRSAKRSSSRLAKGSNPSARREGEKSEQSRNNQNQGRGAASKSAKSTSRPKPADRRLRAKPRKAVSPQPASAYEGERIAKVIARAGLCSRREAEEWVSAGRVTVDGRQLTSPAVNIQRGQDIRVDGKPLAAPDPPRLWRFHKPTGRVTSARDPQGRPTIFADLPATLPRLHSVGRLDINTEGLLLLTNDGALKRYLELPETGWLRRYRVRAFGRPDPDALAALKNGITIEGIEYRGIYADLERQQGNNAWMSMSLREGKNREIKKVLAHLGLTVNRLIRLSFGPFQLGHLPVGQVEEVPRRILRQQLGAKWADFAEGYDATHRAERPPASPSARRS